MTSSFAGSTSLTVLVDVTWRYSHGLLGLCNSGFFQILRGTRFLNARDARHLRLPRLTLPGAQPCSGSTTLSARCCSSAALPHQTLETLLQASTAKAPLTIHHELVLVHTWRCVLFQDKLTGRFVLHLRTFKGATFDTAKEAARLRKLLFSSERVTSGARWCQPMSRPAISTHFALQESELRQRMSTAPTHSCLWQNPGEAQLARAQAASKHVLKKAS